jgi:hypothetical protein
MSPLPSYCRFEDFPGPLHQIALESLLIARRQMLVKHHMNAINAVCCQSADLLVRM